MRCPTLETMTTSRQGGVAAGVDDSVKLVSKCGMLRGVMRGGDVSCFSSWEGKQWAGPLVSASVWRIRAARACGQSEGDGTRQTRKGPAGLSRAQPEQPPAPPEVGDAALGRCDRRDRA